MNVIVKNNRLRKVSMSQEEFDSICKIVSESSCLHTAQQSIQTQFNIAEGLALRLAHIHRRYSWLEVTQHQG